MLRSSNPCVQLLHSAWIVQTKLCLSWLEQSRGSYGACLQTDRYFGELQSAPGDICRARSTWRFHKRLAPYDLWPFEHVYDDTFLLWRHQHASHTSRSADDCVRMPFSISFVETVLRTSASEPLCDTRGSPSYSAILGIIASGRRSGVTAT